MKTQFKLLMLMLITSAMGFGQVKEIFKKSYDAKDLRTLALDLEGAYVQIEESQDGKIHFDYTIEFENFTEKKMNEKLKEITTSVKIIDDKLQFKVNGNNTSSDVSFNIETLFGITFEGDNITFKNPTSRQFRKSMQSFIGMNSGSRVKSLKEYLKNLRALDEKGNKTKIKEKNVKILRTKFVIKIPKDLNLNVVALSSNLTFKLDLQSHLTFNTRLTSLKFQDINNPFNVFDVVNGSFRANRLKGGTYKFTHVDEVQIAQLTDVDLDSEFSEIKVGEISDKVRIIDFNSKFWFHNFSVNFGVFKMSSEYSEINLFLPEKSKYFIETFGHNTVHYWDGITTEIPPSRKNEHTKMMVIGEKENQNQIKIHITNGIIRFGEDFIDVEK